MFRTLVYDKSDESLRAVMACELGYSEDLNNLESDEIDTFASIVAIADVYDAMTAARSYRAPKCAFQVIAAFEEDGFQKYNPKVIFTFLQRVASCYNNSRVLLSDGTAGQIVYLNKNALSRPIVDTADQGLIDLSQSANKNIFIKAIL